MNMKLSYRDKVVAIIIICILVLIVGIIVVIKPKVAELEVVKNNLSNVQAEEQRIDEKINTLPNLINQIKTTAVDIGEIQKNFYVEADPYFFEKSVIETLRSYNLNVKEIKTTYATANDIPKYVVKPANIVAYDMKMNADVFTELPQEVYDAYNKVKATNPATVKIGVTEMEFKFETEPGYDTLMKVMNELAKDEKSLIVYKAKSSLETTGDENLASNTFYATIYTIVPLDVDKLIEEADKLKQ